LNYLRHFDKVIIYNYYFEPQDNSADLVKRGFYLVGADRIAGARKLAKLLREHGHTTIALQDFKEESPLDAERTRVFRNQGFKLVNLMQETEDTHVPADMGMLLADRVKTAVRQEKITAACFFREDYAAYTIQHLQKMNIRVPQKVSVVSCHQMPATELFSPAITSLSIPIPKMVARIKSILQTRTQEHRFPFNPDLMEKETLARI
jgi:DNA-binding LacI/PurR family transcriptional regulator